MRTTHITWLGRTWTLAVLVPLAAIGLLGALLTVHPFLKSRVTGDRSDHHLLDRPRDAPTRTAVGAAGLTVYGALWAAASADLVATQFRVALEDVVGVLRAVLLLGPVVAFVVARQVCATLRAAERDRHAHGAHGRVDALRFVRADGAIFVADGGNVKVATPHFAQPHDSQHRSIGILLYRY